MLKNKLYNAILYYSNNFFKNILNRRYGRFKINLSKKKLEYYDDFISQNIDIWNPVHSINNIKFTNIGLSLNDSTKIQSKYLYNYGIYEFNIEVPISDNINSSIYLTTEKNKYTKFNIFNYINNNNENIIYFNQSINYGIYGLNHKVINFYKTLKYTLDEVKTYYINIKINLQENYIKIYYNNYQIQYITDKSILKYFKNQNININIETNNSGNQTRPFIIKNFSYYKNIN